MSDSVVQPYQADGSTKLVDTSELTRADGKVVERQRVNLSDPTIAGALAQVDPAGNLATIDSVGNDLLRTIVAELRTMNAILAHGFGVEVDSIRSSSSGD